MTILKYILAFIFFILGGLNILLNLLVKNLTFFGYPLTLCTIIFFFVGLVILVGF
jgi:hypothetical protein